MKRYCRILLFILTVILILSLTSTVCLADGGLDNFKKDAVYTSGRFADVASSAWYANSVKDAYEYGLVKGTSDTTFNPTGNITIAEAITLAARLNSIYYTGSANFVQGMPWYQVFVDYAVSNGIIRNGEYSDYNAKATRAQFATIFAAAMPEAAFAKINSVEIGSLPDVSGYEAYGSAVYKLYNAGILTGNDDYGTFLPASNIQRSEVAAIVTRMADTSLRKAVNLKPVPVVPQSIVLSESQISLAPGQSKKLTATVMLVNEINNENTQTDATENTVTWSTNNASVANVNADGVVTAVKTGYATITAKTSNGLTAICSVTVKTSAYDFLVDYAKQHGTYDKYTYSYEYRYYTYKSTKAMYYFDIVYQDKKNNLLLRSMSLPTDIAIFTIEIPPTVSGEYSGTYAYTLSNRGTIDAWLSTSPATYTEDTLPTLDKITGTAISGYDARRLYGATLNLNLAMIEEKLLIPNGYTVVDLGFLCWD